MTTVKETARIGEGKPGPGRPKGVPNKTTALLKDAILKAAQEAGGGGEEGVAEYLKTQATVNPGPFLSLLGKVLPMQVTGEGDGPVKLEITWQSKG
jgi:hypothetical protein